MLSCIAFAHAPEFDARDVLRRLHHQPNARLSQVKQVHARILRLGIPDDPALLLPSLLRLYSSHARFDLASSLFASLFPSAAYPPPTIAWNLTIRAHAFAGAPLDALRLFRRMAALGVPPDKFTFPFLLKACSELSTGRAVHALAIKFGFHRDRFFQNTLIHFYFSCGDPLDGRRVFDRMRARTIVSWTALISGLLACGEIDEARVVFEVMPARNVVSWTAMIDGYVRNDLPDEAFRLFRRMQEENVRPNEFTIVALSLACSQLGSLSLGRWVHELAQKSGGLERSVYVGTALVDMYSKCCSLEDALKVFDQMPSRSLATWNTMITSLGIHGRGKEAVMLLGEMEKDNARPDHITFVGVLNACTREGMIQEGCRFFTYMIDHYGIEPCYEHLRCLVELLDRANELEAVEMARSFAPKLSKDAARMLLEACQGNGNARLAQAVSNVIRGLEAASDHSSSMAPSKQTSYFEWEVG